MERNKEDRFLACKIVRLSNWDKEDLKSEITIMTYCKHKNILRYYETYYYEGCIFIVLEYMDKGNLLQFYRKLGKEEFSEDVIAYIM